MAHDKIHFDLLELLEASGISTKSVIIYGSYAIQMQQSHSDIDLVVYVPEIDFPDRHNLLLYDNIKVSVNMIGDSALKNPSFIENSGWYFISKLLSPIIVLTEQTEFEKLTQKIFKTFILGSLCKVVPDGRFERSFTPEQLLALIYQTLFKGNFAFLVYFRKWYSSSSFIEFWSQKVKMIGGVVNNLKSNEDIKIIDNSITFYSNNKYTEVEKELIFQHMSANFWHFYYKMHQNDEDSINTFFLRVKNKYRNVTIRNVCVAQNFLQNIIS